MEGCHVITAFTKLVFVIIIIRNDVYHHQLLIYQLSASCQQLLSILESRNQNLSAFLAFCCLPVCLPACFNVCLSPLAYQATGVSISLCCSTTYVSFDRSLSPRAKGNKTSVECYQKEPYTDQQELETIRSITRSRKEKAEEAKE